MLWPTTCLFCKEADTEEASEYCSASCKAKAAQTHDAAFGKAFSNALFAAVKEGGPYWFSATSEFGKCTMECFPTLDSGKSGSKIPVRHCQWNDGIDVRTKVRFNGEELSFKALKEKISSCSFEEAENKMRELKDRLKAVAVQSVQAAKIAVVASLAENSSAAKAAQPPKNAARIWMDGMGWVTPLMEEAKSQSTSVDELAQDKKRRKTDNMEMSGSFMDAPINETSTQMRKADNMETEAKAARENTDNVEVGTEAKLKAATKSTDEVEVGTSPGTETKANSSTKSTDKVEVGTETKAKATIRNTDDVQVGSWVTVQAASRRTVDRAKADVPCLVTLVDSSYVHVLYPNLLSVFLSEKSDGEVSIKFRTEKCDLHSIRAYSADIKTLDRKMVMNLCQAVMKAAWTEKPITPQSKASIAAASSLQSEASTTVTPPKLSKHVVRGSDWLRQFTARVARAFKDAGREALDKSALHTKLLSDYPSAEIDEGLVTLEVLNKVIISDEAIFLAC